jgi:hypothetical protein
MHFQSRTIPVHRANDKGTGSFHEFSHILTEASINVDEKAPEITKDSGKILERNHNSSKMSHSLHKMFIKSSECILSRKVRHLLRGGNAS